MKKATISQTKNRLSAYLDLVRRGETILILDRETPIAWIVPVGPGDGEPNERGERLERAGVIRRGTGEGIEALLEQPLPRPRARDALLRALMDERGHGR